MEDLLKVGVITTTHGVRGEVKVYPTTDPERFPELDYVLLDTGREKRKLEIEKVRFFKNLVILKFKGIDNINDIEMLKNAGYSYAVANAREEVQAAAKAVCPSYLEDGVLQVLKSLL